MRLFTIVPQQSRYLVERLGKYHKTLDSGFHFVIPFFDQIEYKMSTKEQIIDVSNQRAITKDNVALNIDGVVFFRIEDVQRAAYNIENYEEGRKKLTESAQVNSNDFNEV
jgi:regulator of protease activity HflC (stomatin/prohibitin superfamily)